jgi:hypothetical protein
MGKLSLTLSILETMLNRQCCYHLEIGILIRQGRGILTLYNCVLCSSKKISLLL